MNHQTRRNAMNTFFLGPLVGLAIAGVYSNENQMTEFWISIGLSILFMGLWVYLAALRLHIEQWQYYLEKADANDDYNEEFFRAVFW